MPRVHYVKRSRKEYPDDLNPGGTITKGGPYYWWRPWKAGTRRSASRPRPSQLAGSEKLSTVYEAGEAVQEAGQAFNDNPGADTWEEFLLTVQHSAETLRDVGSEYEESADTVADYFGETEQVGEMREKAYILEEAADQLEAVGSDADGLEVADALTPPEEAVEAVEAALSVEPQL